jgi:leucyl-tRNA synthetase
MRDFTRKTMTEINQKQIELKWQKKWKQEKVFEPKIDTTKEKYFGTVAYPYANSILHIGHGRGYTAPDVFLRYQRLRGKNVLFPLGYHISGTPVLAVSDAIVRGDKDQIKRTRDALKEYVKTEKEIDTLIESFKDPMNIANFFSGTIEDSLDSIGVSIDWSRQFSTGDKNYQKFIEWQFKKLHEAGILVQGKYPILFSPEDANAVGEDDIKDGDQDKVSLSEMTYILFELKNKKNEFIAVATLRPDALFGTTNLWINSSGDYVRCSVQNGEGKEQIWIVDKQAIVKLEHQYDYVKIISEHKGSDFLEQVVVTPLTGHEVTVYDANFLDPNHGTGIAYSSPAGSPHDFMGLQDAKKDGRVPKSIEPIVSVECFDKKGEKIVYSGSCAAEDKCNKFKVTSSTDAKLEDAKTELYKEEHYSGKLTSVAGEFGGLFIKQAKDKVKDKLVELNLAGIFYETSRRAVTRGGDNVIVACLDGQWFLNYKEQETKDQALELLGQMEYTPIKLKATQEGYLNWVEMRPCARKRGIGTPLPYDTNWVIESLSDSTIYQMLYLVYGIITREHISEGKLTSDVFDFVMLGQGSCESVSKKSGLSVGVLGEMREQVMYWKSFDLRYTGGTHLSNHLSFLIFHYALIFDKEYWPKHIAVGGMLIRDGNKISKSKGNGLPLVQVPKQYGADLYRLYVVLAANFDVEMDFREDDIKQLERRFDRWKELITDSLEVDKVDYASFNSTNKWLISRFYSRVEEYFEFFEGMRMREAMVSVFYEFLNEINYHERRTSKKETLLVLRFIVEDYLKIMTPCVPHVCEELNQLLGNKVKEEKGFISLESLTTKTSEFINTEVEELEEIISTLVTSISREIENKPDTRVITLVQAREDRFNLFDSLKELLSNGEKPDFKKIMGTLSSNFSDDKKFISKFVPKTLGSGLSFYLSKTDEKNLLEDTLDFLKKEFEIEFEIKTAEEMNMNSAGLVPGRPSIVSK